MTRAENIKYNFNCVSQQRKINADEIKRKKEKLNKMVKESIKKAYSSHYNCSVFQLQDCYAEARKLQNLLDEAYGSFSRRYISIPFAGYIKQGRTTAILSLLNLRRLEELHAVSGFLFYNDRTIKQGELRAKLTFFSKEEFTEIVRDYIEKISENYLKEYDISFDDIEYISIPLLEMETTDRNYEKREHMKTLRKIVDAFNTDTQAISLKNIIGKMPITVRDISELNEYTGWSSFDYNPMAGTGTCYSTFLGVKKVEVFCCFPEDIGNVVIADEGLSYDGKYFFENHYYERLLCCMKQEADGVVVVRKPNSGIRTEDIQLFNELKRAFKETDTSKWLFYLVNQHEGVNDSAVECFLRDIKKGDYFTADAYKANFFNQNELWEAFFPMLETLSQNLLEIDEIYMQQINKEYEKVINNFKSFWEE